MQKGSFDDAYQREGLLFGDTPSVELRNFLDENPFIGVALDIGCGDGRDTVPLLRRGFIVTAIDQSKAAIDKLHARTDLTPEFMQALTTAATDVRTWDWPLNTFDLIIAITLLDHLTADEAPRIIERMIRAAKKDAILFVQVHTVEDAAVTGKAPASEFAAEIQHYFEENELLDHFRPYTRILRYEERVEWDYDHGEPHMHGFAILLGRVLGGEKL